MPQLSLDCLTLTDTPPDELVRAAAMAGFDLVSLWTGAPVFPRHGVTARNRQAVARALADTGVGVHTIEVFDLVSEAALESYRPSLQLGAELGARSATTIHYSNPDREDAVRLLHRFAAIAADYGLATSLEPISVGRTRTLMEAANLIADGGADVGITFDFLHLVRTGGSPQHSSAMSRSATGRCSRRRTWCLPKAPSRDFYRALAYSRFRT
jgi:sugar phosphate isomerase/epimerase